jgi:hypothetical protein
MSEVAERLTRACALGLLSVQAPPFYTLTGRRPVQAHRKIGVARADPHDGGRDGWQPLSRSY